MTIRMAGLAVLASVLVVACTKKESAEREAETQQTSEASQPPQGWATVNGSHLTEAELDAAVERFFGDQMVDARAVRNLRESLVASRALAQQAERSLDAATLQSIELATRAYREERLLAAYLDQTTNPEPVSAKSVEAYYQRHLADFGAKTVKRLEILRADFATAQATAAEAAVRLNEAANQSDWAAWAAANPEPAIQHLRLVSNNQLSARIRAAIKPMQADQVSGVIVDQGAAYLVRVVAIEEVPAKPLSEVSGEIRRRLAAGQLKAAISKISEDVLADSVIERRYD